MPASPLTIHIKADKLKIEIDSADVRDALKKSQANASVLFLMDHFQTRGGREYWGGAAKATTAQITGDGVLVSVKQPGVRLHWLGGTVRPGKGTSSKTGAPTRALAIPQTDALRGIMPGGHAGPLAFVPARSGALVGLLVDGVQKTSTRGKNKGQPYVAPAPNGAVKYALVTRTVHHPDPTVLPLTALGEHLVSQTAQALALILRHQQP